MSDEIKKDLNEDLLEESESYPDAIAEYGSISAASHPHLHRSG